MNFFLGIYFFELFLYQNGRLRRSCYSLFYWSFGWFGSEGLWCNGCGLPIKGSWCSHPGCGWWDSSCRRCYPLFDCWCLIVNQMKQWHLFCLTTVSRLKLEELFWCILSGFDQDWFKKLVGLWIFNFVQLRLIGSPSLHRVRTEFAKSIWSYGNFGSFTWISMSQLLPLESTKSDFFCSFSEQSVLNQYFESQVVYLVCFNFDGVSTFIVDSANWGVITFFWGGLVILIIILN